MCGIVGFINCGSQGDLQRAVEKIRHRGPDHQQTRWFSAHNSGLGHTRLSILDLSDAGNQPMFDNVSGNWIVLNGEIFNFKEVRAILEKKGHRFFSTTDTEVVLYAFYEWGSNCLDYFNGMFSFAIFNENSGSLFAARDRLGIKPFYYYYKHKQLAFASEIKAILECSTYKREPDLYSLHTSIHYQAEPFTGFKDILKLPPGHCLTISNGTLNINKYWDISPVETVPTIEHAKQKLNELLLDAVDLQMVSDVPIGVLLSGGLDSSIISVLMQKRMSQPLNAFTIKFKDQDLKRQGNVDDSFYAAKISNQYGFNYKEILIEPNITDLLPKMVWHLDEPIADPAAINTYLIAKAAKKNGIQVLLSGMGADEVFGGYRSYLACIKADYYQTLPFFVRKIAEMVVKKIPDSNSKRNFRYIRWLKQFLQVASLNRLERSMVIKNSALSKNEFNSFFTRQYDYENSPAVQNHVDLFNAYPNISYLTKLCYIDSKSYITNHNLAYSDKAMMAAGVEGRPPLVDHRIVEFLFSLSPSFRIKNNTQKYLLKKVSEKYLPKEIIYRPKAPFSAPMRGWLKNELKEMVQDILSYESLSKRGLYNPLTVQKLISDNNSGTEDNSQLIWRLMVNEIWFRTFFEK